MQMKSPRARWLASPAADEEAVECLLRGAPGDAPTALALSQAAAHSSSTNLGTSSTNKTMTHIGLEDGRGRSTQLHGVELARDELRHALVHDENVGKHVPAGDLGGDAWFPIV